MPRVRGTVFIEDVKQNLRRTIREKLSVMAPAVAHARSMAACKRLMDTPEFARSSVVMIYLPIPGEVDVSPVALRGWQEQKIICAPKLSWDHRHMLPIEIRSLQSGLVSTVNGLREPADGEQIEIGTLDMVLVPALVFDRSGNRLGRGAGFYDRFLGAVEVVGISVGNAFGEQIADEVPVHDHDVPVNMLVTDEEIIRFAPPDRYAQGKDAKREIT
ncbi:MAG: 5-formyltetrahydrofolate cyclo-ligase [Phycisphaerae bacterium]|nr:5-formyltetrahydrofolate cyclo-ligase [Phycisphaerae bacterium]